MQIDFTKWLDVGYRVFPLNGKHPHWPSLPTDKDGKPTWLPFVTREPTEEELQKWRNSNGYTGVAVLTGKVSGIIALDWDCVTRDYPEIISFVPDSPVIRVGKSPKWMRFYKYNEELPSKKITLCVDEKTNTQDGIELLTNGRYFVADGMHPDTKKPYFYVGEHLLNVSPEELPEFPLSAWLRIEEIAEKYKNTDTNYGGGRHNALLELCGSLYAQKISANNIIENLIALDKSFPESYFSSHKNTPEKMLDSVKKTHKRNHPELKKAQNVNEEPSIEVPDADNFFSFGKHGIKPRFQFMAEYLKQTYKLIVTDDGNYIYEKTHFYQASNLKLEQLVYNLTKAYSTPNHVDGFKKIARVLAYNKDFFSSKPHGKMNLINGLLDVKTKTLTAHNPEHKQTSMLPINFKPDATATRWEQFLNQIFLGDSELIELTREMFGYTLLGGDPFLQRAFCLYGTGRNGKSTLLHVLKCLLGKDNYTAVPMNLLDKPFSCVMLNNKLANICEETPTDRINAEIFKTAVGGGAIVAAQKNQPEFLMDVSARFIFACNELPFFKDRTKGLEDRLVLIPFELYLSDEERDFGINKKLEAELSGILNWALAGAERILDWGRLTSPEKSKTLKEEYKRDSDSVYDYFCDYLIVSADPASAISISDTYNKYSNWCRETGRLALGQKTFTKALRTHATDFAKKELSDISDYKEAFKTTMRNFGVRIYEKAIPHLLEKP